MKFSRLLPILGLLFCWQGLSAQDIHYTLFDYSPLRSNPALTGAFEGSIRVGGILRGQWFTVANADDFMSPSFYADAPVIRGFREQDWVGVGLNFISDRYGDFNLQTVGGQLSGSYHLANRKRTQVLTLGVQYGQMQRRIDFRANTAVSEETINENLGGGGLNFENSEFGGEMSEPTANYTDINAGLLFRTEIDKKTKLEVGVAALHINAPRATLLNGGIGLSARRNLTAVGHAIYSQELNNDWSINPKAYWQTTEGGKNEIQLQGWVGKRVNPDFKLNFGLGWRVNDAGNLLFGIEHKDLRAALAYDLNLSGANVITNYQGGFELAAYYIFKIYKQPELPPTILCPRF